MAANTNVVVLRGRLTRDPESRQVGEHTKVSFSLAVNRYGDKVSFFDVEAWRRPAEIVQAYVTKGKLITVNGYLDQQTWEQDGHKRSKVVVVARDVELDPKSESSSRSDTPADDDFSEPKVNTEDVPF